MTQVSPSQVLRKEGCCSTFSPLIPVPPQKKKERKARQDCHHHFSRVPFFFLSNFRQSGKGKSSPQTSDKYLLKHPVPKALHSQYSCSHKNRNKGPMDVFILLPIRTCNLQPGELLLLPGYLFLSSKAQWFLKLSTQALA